MSRGRPAVGIVLLAAAAFLIYAYQLGDGPPSLSRDEGDLGAQAQSIAQGGRDADGGLLPLYFHVRDNQWAQPLPIYVTALSVMAAGSSQWSLRLPSVFVAIVDIVLIYLVAQSLFDRASLPFIAAGLLAVAPAHFIHGRLALPDVYPLPFVLSWLLCMIAFVSQPGPWPAFGGALCLGIGFYASPASVLMMPAYLIVTLAIVWQVRSEPMSYVAAGSGFVVPLLILIPWFAAHYGSFRFTLGDWGLHTLANPRDGFRHTILSWVKVGRRSSLYWDFFSPAYLFFTRVFLSVTAIPLIYGLYRILTTLWNEVRWRVVLAGFLVAPLAAAAFDEPRAVGRALTAVPFGVLIAVAGFDGLLGSRKMAPRLLAVVVLLLMPLQFYRFYGAP